MPTRPVCGVVLAAGPSRRFGDQPPKQLASIGGEPLVRRAVRRAAASRLSEVIVVIGFQAERVRAAIEDLPVVLVLNEDFAEGQSGSVRTGLAAVPQSASAAMFLPVDQPALSVALIDALIDCYQRSGGSLIVPAYRGRRGAPVVIDRKLFDELASITGDVGGRQLFGLHEDEIVELPLPSAEPLQDVDLPDDLRRFGA